MIQAESSRARPPSRHAGRTQAARRPGTRRIRITPSADVADDCGSSDRVLLEQIHAGSAPALGVLLNRYWAPLMCYASVFVESRDDAEDVVQETFVHVWQYRARYTASGLARSYLYRITRNLALNARRHRVAQHGRDQRGAADLYARGGPAGADLDAEADSLRADVDRAIAALPERRRAVFLLSRVEGRTHDEIAQRLGLCLQTVANHMGAALADLRRALAHHLHE